MSYNSSFYCPITGELMIDPVVDLDGNTFERKAIEEWIKTKGKSPVTRRALKTSDLVPNKNLKDAIDEDMIAIAAFEALKINCSDVDKPCDQCSNSKTIGGVIVTVPIVKPVAPLGMAVKIRDLAKQGKMKHILSLEASFDIRSILDVSDADGYTALMWAADNGHIDVITYLLDKGVDIHKRTKRGSSAVMWASDMNKPDVIKLLVDRGGIITDENYVGETSLIWAAAKGHIETVRILVDLTNTTTTAAAAERSTYIDHKPSTDSDKSSALNEALKNGHMEVIKFLIEQAKAKIFDDSLQFVCAKVEVLTYLLEQKEFPVEVIGKKLITATEQNQDVIVRILLQKCPVQLQVLLSTMDQSTFGTTVVVNWAVEKGFDDITENLLSLCPQLYKGPEITFVIEKGKIDLAKKMISKEEVSVQGKNKDGVTALVMAVRKKQVDIVTLLLGRICEEEKEEKDYLSAALYEACENGCVIIANILIDFGIDVNGVDPTTGNSFLTGACKTGHTAIVELLFNKGLGLENAFTSLVAAIERGHLEVVKLLIQRGGVPVDTTMPSTGETALLIASSKGYFKIVHCLLDADANVNVANSAQMTPLHFAVEKGDVTTVTKILARDGCNINATNEKKISPLHLAIEKKHFPIAQLLIDKGADISLVNAYGNNALLLACNCGATDIAKRLIVDLGADVNWVNTVGSSALTWASEKGQKEIVKLLLLYGADVECATTEKGFTSLILATAQGHTEIVKMLLEYGANVNVANKAGKTALTIATQNKKKDIMALLQTASAAIVSTTTSSGVVDNTTSHILLTSAADGSTTNSTVRSVTA